MRNFIFLTLVFLSFLSCKSAYPQEKNETLDVSIIQLIANPQDFENKKIRIKGYLSFQHEGNAIYLHKEDYENVISQNAIYLYIKENDFVENLIEKPYKGYMSIVGIFTNKDKGHRSSFVGAIKEVIFIRRLGE
jgi:hypothetical protein